MLAEKRYCKKCKKEVNPIQVKKTVGKTAGNVAGTILDAVLQDFPIFEGLSPDISKKCPYCYSVLRTKARKKTQVHGCEDLLYNYLRENRSAFTVRALENRLDKIITDHDEHEYARKNLQNILNEMKVQGRIHSTEYNNEDHYFIP